MYTAPEGTEGEDERAVATIQESLRRVYDGLGCSAQTWYVLCERRREAHYVFRSGASVPVPNCFQNASLISEPENTVTSCPYLD